ncbi:MAG: hypothetical protein HYY06_05830 [Deltaproteobacteria bacterium]|nr:hypothetical protein [Deltaproteobacteria bacterium]
MFAKHVLLAFVVASVWLGSTSARADAQCPPNWIEIRSPEDGSSYLAGTNVPVEVVGEFVDTDCREAEEPVVTLRLYSMGRLVWENVYFVDAGPCCTREPFEIVDLLPRLSSGRYRLTASLSDDLDEEPITTDEVELRILLRPIRREAGVR